MRKGILLSVIFVMGFYSCEKGISDIDIENFMYLSLSGAKSRPDIKKLDLANIRDTLFNITVSYGGTTHFNRGNIEVGIEDDMTLVGQFNTDHVTSYLPLPAEAYSLSSNKATITDGNSSSEPLKLTVKTGAINLSNEYLLPITVKSVSGGNVPLHDEYKTLYLAFMADIDNEIDMNRWKNGGASSAQSAVENLFDGQNDTYWQSDRTGLPQWFIVDMDGYKRVDGFTLCNMRTRGQNNLPKHIRFETSLNKTDWQTVLDVAELPQSRLLQILQIEETVIARYIRVTVLSTWNNADETYLTALSIYSGEKPEPEQDIERENWTIVDFSSQWSAGWGATEILNDNLSVPWHTDPADQMPHWAIVDMKKELRISGFIYANMYDLYAAPKRIRFEVSRDGSSWTTATVVDDVPNILEMQTFPCDNPVTARYFKLTVETNYANAPYTYMSYISIY